MAFDFKGVVSATITPLTQGGTDVDFDALRRYCDFLVSTGVQGIFICGTTGEGPMLSVEERKAIAKTVVQQVGKRIQVIVHTGDITTRRTVDLSRHAQETGADAVGVVLPYFHPLDEEALVEHFTRVAAAVPGFPVFIYNIPQYTVNNFTPSILAKILERVDNFAGMKTSNPDLFQLQEYVSLLGPGKSLFYGCDRLDLPALAIGASGIISGNASAFPEPFVKLFHAFERGDLKAAREQYAFNCQLAITLKDGRYPAIHKKALEFRGVRGGQVRPPQRELFPEETEELRGALQKMGML